RTRRSEWGKGSGSRSTALTTEKIAVLAPIPRASTATAARVNPGLLARSLNPCRRSWVSVAMDSFLHERRGAIRLPSPEGILAAPNKGVTLFCFRGFCSETKPPVRIRTHPAAAVRIGPTLSRVFSVSFAENEGRRRWTGTRLTGVAHALLRIV